MPQLMSWWSQPDQFDWVTSFLRQRDLATYVRRAEQHPLTGLPNRQAFTESVTVRRTQHAAGHTHLAVMMLGLDDFKRRKSGARKRRLVATLCSR